MQIDETYLNRLKEKLESAHDEELKELVFGLINEINIIQTEINRDVLTDTYNRRILPSITNCNIIVMCDIDDFKLINDTFGHDIGDDVIKKVANIIKNNIRSNDYVCRYGGDEFLIAFCKCDYHIVVSRMKKLQQEIKENINLPDCEVTISIGISENKNNNNLHNMIKEADKALYHSKKDGKNKIKIYM